MGSERVTQHLQITFLDFEIAPLFSLYMYKPPNVSAFLYLLYSSSVLAINRLKYNKLHFFLPHRPASRRVHLRRAKERGSMEGGKGTMGEGRGGETATREGGREGGHFEGRKRH